MAKKIFSANPFSTAIAGIVTLCALLLATEFFWPQLLAGFKQAVPATYDPMIYLVDEGKQAGKQAQAYLSTPKPELIKQVAQLQQALQTQRIAYKTTAALTQENMRLRQALALANTQQHNYQSAEVIGLSTSDKREYFINKGKQHGVYLGQVAVDAYGVVGQITAVYRHSAKVSLLTDTSQSVSARVLRTNMVAIVSGRGKGLLSMDYIPNTSDVKVGDVLYSSGIGERFAGNYPIGVVHSIRAHGKTEFSDIAVKPFAKLDHPDVLLLLKLKKTNPRPLPTLPVPASPTVIATTPAPSTTPTAAKPQPAPPANVQATTPTQPGLAATATPTAEAAVPTPPATP